MSTTFIMSMTQTQARRLHSFVCRGTSHSNVAAASNNFVKGIYAYIWSDQKDRHTPALASSVSLQYWVSRAPLLWL